MGDGGPEALTKNQKDRNTLKRVPHEKPPFALKDLKIAIPPHCFNRSFIRSFSYVMYDITISFIFYYVAITYIHLIPSPFDYLAWTLYWVLQGCTLTGVWVLGHECGHHAISDYQYIDDTIGLILHSFLLVPYFSFKYSHCRHHSNTNSLDRDEVYVPKPKSQLPWFSKYLNNPFGRVITITLTLTLGWPSYLAFNVSGRLYDRFACHYNPYSPIYNARERLHIYLSDVGVMTMMYALYRAWLVKGLTWLVYIYGVPLVIGNFVVLITYLQHTHVSLPHYDSFEWDWLKGALATVDRDYGILNSVFHHTTETHVVHHLFPTIPHYHTREATKAIKPILGDYYQFDDTPFYKAIWREARECLYVEPDENTPHKGVFWYKNKY